ncbi:glycosyltransferase family 4 protein [Litorivicinus lipolyticus]|uniref:glycosyltransferase family 4 protein n=1 Tax=Litorivicinus lipolyticus TaxID=418701 RepID=UPI003B5C97C4
MKILHTEASVGWGGQEIRILLEADQMRRRGHDVSIACDPTSLLASRCQQFDFEPLLVPMRKKSFRYLPGVRRMIRDLQPDLVNTHSSNDAWLVGLAGALTTNRPVIIRTRHVSAPVRPNLATRWLYTRAHDGIATTGKIITNHLRETFGLTADRVVTVPTGVDTAHFAPRTVSNVESDGFVVGIAATLRSWKGHSYLLQALALLESDVRLLIVGDGPQEGALKALAVELGIAERVEFTGYQTDVRPYLAQMDVFCLPSYANEGVPQALLQASAVELPIVTTTAGGIPDLITDGYNGLVVESKSAQQLAAAIVALRADSGLAGRLGSQARQRVIEAHSLGKMADDMEALYRHAGARF